MRTITSDRVVKKMFGTTALLELPVVPHDAPHEVREGVARRRLVMETGQCPCGARMAGPNRATIRHEDDCPALDEPLYAAIRRWRRG